MKAAKQKKALNDLKRLLVKKAKKMGYRDPDIRVFPKGHSADYPVLSWEEGPYEWAPALTGGSDLHAGETGRYSQENPWFDEVEAIKEKHQCYFECQNNFQLSAWEG